MVRDYVEAPCGCVSGLAHKGQVIKIRYCDRHKPPRKGTHGRSVKVKVTR